MKNIYLFLDFEKVISNFPKKSNSLEGLHRSLNERIVYKKPSLLKVFEGLEEQQNLNEMK